MKIIFSLVLIITFGVIRFDGALAQTKPESFQTVTLYSPLKYRRTDLRPMKNGQFSPDSRRAHLNLLTGEIRTVPDAPTLTYGTLYAGQDHDWFMLSMSNESRSVIKDLGNISWTEKFQIPSLTPLPELRAGEKRSLSVNTSGKDGADGARGLDGANGVDGADADRNSSTGENSSRSGKTPSPVVKAVDSKSDDKPIYNLPVLAKAILGHMYVIHLINGDSDFYVLIHVDGIERGDNCTFSWKRLSSSSASLGKSADS